MRKKIALIIPTFSTGGGVPAVGRFLYNVIQQSDKYEADIISLSGHYKDSNNVRLANPISWLKGIRVTRSEHLGLPYTHYGTKFPELPRQTFLPRTSLTEHLNKYDLIQIVAGTPAWGMIAKHVVKPVTLQVATLIRVEREKKIESRQGLRKMYQKFATNSIENLEKKALKYTDHIFVENNWMFDEMKKRTSSEKVTFSPPGIDTNLFQPISYNKKRTPYILSVGRFSDPRKNVRLLFEAYSRVKQLQPLVPKLVLAGKTGPTPEDLMYARELNIMEDIEIKLDVSPNELISLYQNADLFILSSDEEGFGMVIMEAMACGIPVVSTDCGGPSTLITNGSDGYLVPVGVSQILADRVQELLSDEEKRRQFAGNARKKILDSFSDEKTGALFIDVYNRLSEG